MQRNSSEERNKMIDTHTHLYMEEYDSDKAEMVARAIDASVSHVILPNVDENSLPRMKSFHELYPDFSSMAIGIHPTEVKENFRDFLKIMNIELQKGGYVAVGEIGIDLHWETNNLARQKEAFEYQLQLAEIYKLPVILHSRDGLEETLDVIQKVKPTVPIIFHSFTGSSEDVSRIREVCDAWFGINGVVTYKNAPALRDALHEIGINRIILETDAPFLSPVPNRGKRNESAFIGHVKDKIAEVLDLRPEEVEEKTDQNAKNIFGI